MKASILSFVNRPRRQGVSTPLSIGVAPRLVLSASAVAEGSPINTVVGRLSVINGGAGNWSYQILDNAGGMFGISADNLVVGATALNHITTPSPSVTVQATNGSDVIHERFELLVIPPLTVLGPLTLSKSEVEVGAPTPTEVGIIIGKTPGSSISIIPNDGRYAVTSDGRVVVGLTASSIGTANYTLRETLAGAANSPHDNNIAITTLPPQVVNLTPPVITGTPTVGSVLTLAGDTWSGDPSVSVQWYRNGVAIAGATDRAYRLVVADTGSNIVGRAIGSKNATSVNADSQPTAGIAIPLGNKTAAGVVLASLLAGASIAGATGVSNYFQVDAAGKFSVSVAGDVADLGIGQYDVPVTGSGLASGKLRFSIEANTFDADTSGALTAALSTAVGLSPTTDWRVALTDDFNPTSAVSLSNVFGGTINHPNYGKASAAAIARYSNIDFSAVPVVSGGSATILARTPKVAKFGNKLTLNGAQNIVLDGLTFRNAPLADIYDGKFNQVASQPIWKPLLSGGGVTGVDSFDQTGAGFLKHANQRKAYVSTKLGKACAISIASQAVVTLAGHGLGVGQAFVFKTTGTLPSPISTSATYYVKSVLSADTFTFSATSGGAEISTLGSTQYGQASVAGPGTGLKAYFIVNADGTIDATSQLVVIDPGTGYDATTRFSIPTVAETTQLSTCQSDLTALTTSALQLQLTANGTTLPKVIVRNCFFGAGPNANINRLPQCIDIRNADQIYIQDCVFENYWAAIQTWFANDIEVTRNFSIGNANDFYKEYPAINPVGTQATTGLRTRILANIAVKPQAGEDWSNSHADFFQPADKTDVTRARDWCVLGNRVFWPANSKAFSSQFILASYSSYPHKQCVEGNLAIISTVNGGQLPNAESKDTAKVRYNTIVRYVAEYLTDNAFSPNQPAAFEPWVTNKGPWVSTTTFAYGVIVSYNGAFYQSLGDGNLNHLPDENNSIYWRPYSQFEMEIAFNTLGEVWTQDPTTTSSTFTRRNADPAGGVISNQFYKPSIHDNAYVSNYTPNTGQGNSYPEVFKGGAAFFGEYQGPNVGYNQYPDKIRTDSYANALADLDAAFGAVPGSMIDGKNYLDAVNSAATVIPVTPLAISGTPGPALAGAAYSFTPVVTGGSGSRTFVLTGSLPAGLSFNPSTGAITGTPTGSGVTSGFAISVTDTSGTASLSNLSISVTAALAINGAPPGATVGISYNFTPAVSGGSGAKSFTLSGSLPAGLSFSSTTGVISGTPTTSGNFAGIGISVTDATGTASLTGLSINVAAARSMFAATRLRFPTVTGTVAAAGVYQNHSFFFGTPDYDTSEPRFFLPRFYQLTTGANPSEIDAPADFNIEGLSIKVGGVWYSAPNAAFVMDASKGPGVLLDAIPGVTLPKNTMIEGRIAWNAPSGVTMIGNVRASRLGEAAQGSTTSLAGKLTDGSALSGANGFSRAYTPAYMVAKGWDGRPVFCLAGDSIEAGANENTAIGVQSTRGNTGYWQRGLDDNTASKRLAYGTLALEGSRPADWATRANWARKLDAVKQATDANGGLPPFTHIGSNHGNNSISASDLYATTQGFWQIMKTEWPNIPIYHSELLPRPASSDGYQSLANQTVTSTDAYNAGVNPGQRWAFSDKLGKGALTGDATAQARLDGWIAGSFAAWRGTAYDTGNNRDKLAPVPFSSTIASAYSTSSTSITLASTAGLSVGDTLIVNPGGTGAFDSVVESISGNVVTMIGGGTAFAAGTPVTSSFHDRTGLHPGTRGHIKIMTDVVIPWKVDQGWV